MTPHEQQPLDFLKTLIETPSPSGYETPVQRLFAERVKPFSDSVTRDVLGNVVAVRNGGGRPRVLLAGHSDEVGLMVKHVSDEGFVYCATVGSPAIPGLIGQPVEILGRAGAVPGVVMARRPVGDEALVYKIDGCWIDIGARDKKDALAAVRPGDPATPVAGFRALRGDRVMGRGFDDRLGVYVIAEVLRRLHGASFEAAVYGVSTTQEEVGSRGAEPCTYAIDPDIGIAVEVTAATDCPETNKKTQGDIALGGGPVLLRGANIHPALGAMLEETAQRQAIPFQVDGFPGPTPTDASKMQMTRGGVATALVKIPLRYMHFPQEVVSLGDVEHAVSLLTHLITSLRKGMDFRQPLG